MNHTDNNHWVKKNNSRIVLVDTLRGFALLGIMLLHAIEHFDLFWEADKNPEIFRSVDPYVYKYVSFLFSGKAYTIFSLMFGLSFFIQMDRAHTRGNDFRLRFLWRLIMLCCIGYIVSLIYSSQILVIYAIMGIPLVMFYRINTKWLVAIAILFMLQIPTIINIIQSYIDPDFAMERNFGRGLWNEAFNTFANGSFIDVLQFNSWKSHIAVWSWMYYNGRYLQLFGLFILGLALGKKRFFERYLLFKKQTLVLCIISIIVFTVLYSLFLNLRQMGIPRPRFGLYYTLLESYSNLALTSVYVNLIILLFQNIHKLNNSAILANYGRLSLTNYIIQPLIGVPIFYGYGLSIYHYFGTTLSLIYGVVFLFLQLWFSNVWLKNFHYGPFEWLWRVLTYLNINIKFKKTTIIKQSV